MRVRVTTNKLARRRKKGLFQLLPFAVAATIPAVVASVPTAASTPIAASTATTCATTTATAAIPAYMHHQHTHQENVKDPHTSAAPAPARVHGHLLELSGNLRLGLTQDPNELPRRPCVVGREVRVRSACHTGTLARRPSQMPVSKRENAKDAPQFGRFGGYSLRSCSGNHSSNHEVNNQSNVATQTHDYVANVLDICTGNRRGKSRGWNEGDTVGHRTCNQSSIWLE